MKQRAKAFYVFFVRPADGDSIRATAVVYCSTPHSSPASLVEALRDEFDARPTPDRIILIGGAHLREHLRYLIADSYVQDNLPPITQYVDPPAIRAAQFDIHGQITDLEGKSFLSASERTALIHAGLQNIFLSRHTVLDAGHGFHYVKPSGKHSQQFIRTANALSSSAEIGFIAFCLLARVADNTTNIYTDTATINSVAYALTQLRSSLDSSLPALAIDSFGSYAGLIEDFVLERNSLCLISASTSGGLEAEIAKKYRIDPNRVVTLYYCGAPTDNRQVLCNVTKSAANPDGVEVIESFASEAACKLCRSNSTRIRIVGDQFLPTDTDYKQVLVVANQAPRWLKDSTRQLAFRESVRAHHHRSSGTQQKRTIYIDLSTCMKGDTPFAQSFDRLMRHAVPASVKRIVHVDDPSSTALAAHIGTFLESWAQPQRVIELIPEEELSRNPRKYETPKGVNDTVLVVAATAVTGRNLQSISQVLRVVHADKPIVYLVGVVRLRSRREWQDVKSNIGYGRRPDEHPVHVALEAYLPGDSVGTKTPWDLEVDTLRKLLERPTARENSGVADFISRRIRCIEDAGSKTSRGLLNDLFLPPYANGGSDALPLKMSGGFVFWPEDYDETRATHADVFLTISAVLHALRDEREPRAELKQHEHRRVVLAPGNFSRFNDPPIQASFLRAAHPSELNYQQKEDWSSEMREFLKFVFEHSHLEHSAASSEFLLALAQNRMRLTPADTEEVLRPLAAHENPFFRLVAQFVLDKLI